MLGQSIIFDNFLLIHHLSYIKRCLVILVIKTHYVSVLTWLFLSNIFSTSLFVLLAIYYTNCETAASICNPSSTFKSLPKECNSTDKCPPEPHIYSSILPQSHLIYFPYQGDFLWLVPQRAVQIPLRLRSVFAIISLFNRTKFASVHSHKGIAWLSPRILLC